MKKMTQKNTVNHSALVFSTESCLIGLSYEIESLMKLLAYSHTVKVLDYAGVTMLLRNYNEAQIFGFICDIAPELCS